jgi:endogenous inhibitor of DNA gyrase (YacG/DUF329 family)
MTEPLAGQSYQVKCLTCGIEFAGTITRRGRRRRFCSEACRTRRTIVWNSRHRLKLRTSARGPMLPLGIDG